MNASQRDRFLHCFSSQTTQLSPRSTIFPFRRAISRSALRSCVLMSRRLRRNGHFLLIVFSLFFISSPFFTALLCQGSSLQRRADLITGGPWVVCMCVCVSTTQRQKKGKEKEAAVRCIHLRPAIAGSNTKSDRETEGGEVKKRARGFSIKSEVDNSMCD